MGEGIVMGDSFIANYQKKKHLNERIDEEFEDEKS